VTNVTADTDETVFRAGQAGPAYTYVRCAVRKDSGDDPDITNKVLVYASVRLCPDKQEICIDGGEGIGRVTRPGLNQQIGKAAINAVPRQMIEQAVEEICEEYGYEAGIEVIVSIPGGELLAKKTFNPRLGIEGGLSILGTTGIVEPMSEAALLDTIELEMKQKMSLGEQYLIMAPGNYGLDFINRTLHIDLEQCIKCSNYIGDSIDCACRLGAKGLLLVGHIGKLVKLGAGVMNTHSRCADARMETLVSCAILAGADAQLARKLLSCVSTEEALALLVQAECLDQTMKILMERITFHLSHRADEQIITGAVVFSERYGILGYAGEAERLLEAAVRRDV
ncbi:MAG TPA: cobalt-precorrin-5B (C(1))-methyltransferase CbiD, partial [Lachnospiraceae bacterium]|nr:cobalt-precorrin-5B (C(1))-methyltransferase CbiD [Lachnospiraceae bacterium]